MTGTKKVQISEKNGIVPPWKTRHGYARFVNDVENSYRFEGRRKETRIYTPAWLTAVRGKMLEFFQTKLLNSSTRLHWL